MYINKFNKYKLKHLELKKQIGGGDGDIVVEFYEYLLNGYTDKSYEPHTKTAELYNTTQGKCGIISKKDTSTGSIQPTPIDRYRTCDPLSGTFYETSQDDFVERYDNESEQIKLNFELSIQVDDEIYYINSESLIQFIRQYGAKLGKFPSQGIVEIPTLNFLYNYGIVNNILQQIYNILSTEVAIYISNFHKYSKQAEPNFEKDTKTLILYINDPGIEYIIFGDLHGSFSTFVRHLLRLRSYEILYENGKINPRYKLIFLGDIFDRGIYGYEIMMLLYILKINNPDSIYLNRGNHEESHTQASQSHSNLLKEINAKFKVANERIYLYNYINDVCKLQHSALLIQNREKYIYMAHGGLPTVYMKEYFYIDKIIQTIIEDTQKIHKKYYMYIDENDSNSVRWNDINSIETIDVPDRNVSIGPDLLQTAYRLGIQLIIRGHQDSIANSALIEDKWYISDTKTYRQNRLDFSDDFKQSSENEEDDWDEYIKQSKPKNVEEFIDTHDDKYTKNLAIYSTPSIPNIYLTKNILDSSKLATLPINKWILPVITISTNTDSGRKFTKDSFARLIIESDLNFLPLTSGAPASAAKQQPAASAALVVSTLPPPPPSTLPPPSSSTLPPSTLPPKLPPASATSSTPPKPKPPAASATSSTPPAASATSSTPQTPPQSTILEAKDILNMCDSTDIETIIQKLNFVKSESFDYQYVTLITLTSLQELLNKFPSKKYKLIIVNLCKEIQTNISIIQRLSTCVLKDGIIYINNLNSTTKNELKQYFITNHFKEFKLE